MNKKISTNTGLITGICILAFSLILHSLHFDSNSPVVLLQFLIMFLGILFSSFLLYKYYADIQFLESFIHNIKTGITALVVIILGNSILFFVISKDQPFSVYTFMVMKTIFSFTLSGLFSAFFTSFIFNTFTKKK